MPVACALVVEVAGSDEAACRNGCPIASAESVEKTAGPATAVMKRSSEQGVPAELQCARAAPAGSDSLSFKAQPCLAQPCRGFNVVGVEADPMLLARTFRFAQASSPTVLGACSSFHEGQKPRVVAVRAAGVHASALPLHS